MIIDNMLDLHNFDENRFDRRNVKVVHKNFNIMAQELNRIINCMNSEQAKVLRTAVDGELKVEREVMIMVLNGFDFNLATHIASIAKYMQVYAGLSEILKQSKDIDQLIRKIENRVDFFIKDLIYQCYFYGIKDNKDVKSADEVYNLFNKIGRKNLPIREHFSFFNEEQNRVFFRLLNELLLVQQAIKEKISIEVFSRMRDINLKRLIIKSEPMFEEFNAD